jgi:hypothetical protein
VQAGSANGTRNPVALMTNLCVHYVHACTKVMYLEQKQLGLGHDKTNIDNEIWLIAGVLSPPILRRYSDSYQLVGPCYFREIYGR